MPTTIAENLRNIQSTKLALKASINAKNVGAINDSTPFSAYPNAIDAIQTGGGSTGSTGSGSSDMSSYTIQNQLTISEYTDMVYDPLKAIKKVYIPEAATTLNSFTGCTNLEEFVVDDNAIYSFSYSANLSCLVNLKKVELNGILTSLTSSMFSGCTSLSEITLPSSLGEIGSLCFSDCSSLSSITLPNKVASLPDLCFQKCSSLTSIAIPSGVTSVGTFCFYYCSKLETVTCNAITPPTLGSDAFANCTALTAIYVPAQSVDAYKNATNWSKYAAKIQAISS